MDAVSKWVYSPYLTDGAPMEAEVMLKVEFRLGGRGNSNNVAICSVLNAAACP